MTKTNPLLDYDEIHALAVRSRQLRASYVAQMIVRLIGLVTRRRTPDPVPAATFRRGRLRGRLLGRTGIGCIVAATATFGDRPMPPSLRHRAPIAGRDARR